MDDGLWILSMVIVYRQELMLSILQSVIRAQEGDLAAIRFAQILIGEDFAHRSAGDAAHVEHGHPVEVFWHGLQIVMNDDDGFASRTQLLKKKHNGAFSGGIHTLERFIHEIKLSILHKSAS